MKKITAWNGLSLIAEDEGEWLFLQTLYKLLEISGEADEVTLHEKEKTMIFVTYF